MPPSARRSSADCTKTTPSQGPNWPTPPLRTAHRGDPLRPGHRRRGEQGHRPPLSGGQHPEAIHALGVEGLSEYIKTIGLYNSKAKNVIETCRILIESTAARSPTTARTSKPCPGWPQDRQRGAQHRLPATGHGGGHAYLPRRQPHRHSTGKERSGGGEETAEVRAARVPARCPPLADPAWPLRLQARKPQCGSCRIEDLCEYKHKTSDD